MDSFVEELSIIYRNNPFRLVKSTTSSTTQSIQQKYQEERLNLQLDDSKGHEDLDNLRQAQSDLIDPRKRWQHAFTWFYLPPESIVDGKIGLADETETAFREKAEKSGPEGLRSKQDLATWLLVLAIHSQDSKAIIRYCIRSIALWSELIEDPLFAGMIRSSYKDDFFDYDRIWEIAVLDPLKRALIERSNNLDIEAVCSFIQAIMETGFTSEDIVKVSESALENIGHGAEIAMDEMIDLSTLGKPTSYEEAINTISPSNDELTILLDSVYDLKDVLETLQEGNGKDSYCVVRWVTFLDDSAKRLRNLANEYVDTLVKAATTRSGRNPSYRTVAGFLIESAESVVISAYARNEIEADTRTLWYNLYMADAYNHLGHGLFKFANTEAEKALSIAENPQQKEQARAIIEIILAQFRGSGFRGRSDPQMGNRKGLLLGFRQNKAWVIGVIVLVIGVLIVASLTNSSTESQSSAKVSSSQGKTSNSTGSSLSTQIQSNQDKLLSLEARADALCQQDQLCTPQNPTYSSRTLYNQFQIIADQHKTLVDQTNVLIDLYNSSLR